MTKPAEPTCSECGQLDCYHQRGNPPAFCVGKQTAPQVVEEVAERYREDYHLPTDEFHDDWDFTGLAQAARFGMAVGMDVANANALPSWKAGDEFLAAREDRKSTRLNSSHRT